jgi:hypothetical protein
METIRRHHEGGKVAILLKASLKMFLLFWGFMGCQCFVGCFGAVQQASTSVTQMSKQPCLALPCLALPCLACGRGSHMVHRLHPFSSQTKESQHARGLLVSKFQSAGLRPPPAGVLFQF